MRRSAVLLSLLAATSSIALAQDPLIPPVSGPDTLQLPARIDLYRENLDRLQSQQRALDSAYQKRLADLASSLERATNLSGRIQILETRTKALEDFNQLRETNARQQARARFEAGRDALTDMVNGVTIIAFMQEMMNLEQDINRTTSLWSDSSFRNLWDDVERVGTGIGLILAGGALVADGNQSNAVLTAGLSMAGVSSLLGYLLGEDRSNGLREKAEFIDLTRRAYDDLNTRYYTLRRYISLNDSLEARLRVFRARYLSSKESQEDTVRAVEHVRVFYQEYELVLKQIPSLLEQFESMQKQYVMTNPSMRAIFEDILARVRYVRKRFDEKVLPILDVSAEIKRILGT